MAKYYARWKTLTPRSGGPSYGDKKSAQARAKKYRKLVPKKTFRVAPNWDKTKWAVEIKEWGF